MCSSGPSNRVLAQRLRKGYFVSYLNFLASTSLSLRKVLSLKKGGADLREQVSPYCQIEDIEELTSGNQVFSAILFQLLM
jgi:hypothetical protein